MGYLRSGIEGSGGHLGTSLGGSDLRVIWGHSEVILGPFLGPLLGNLIRTTKKAFIWPWVGL